MVTRVLRGGRYGFDVGVHYNYFSGQVISYLSARRLGLFELSVLSRVAKLQVDGWVPVDSVIEVFLSDVYYNSETHYDVPRGQAHLYVRDILNEYPLLERKRVIGSDCVFFPEEYFRRSPVYGHILWDDDFYYSKSLLSLFREGVKECVPFIHEYLSIGHMSNVPLGVYKKLRAAFKQLGTELVVTDKDGIKIYKPQKPCLAIFQPLTYPAV